MKYCFVLYKYHQSLQKVRVCFFQVGCSRLRRNLLLKDLGLSLHHDVHMLNSCQMKYCSVHAAQRSSSRALHAHSVYTMNLLPNAGMAYHNSIVYSIMWYMHWIKPSHDNSHLRAKAENLDIRFIPCMISFVRRPVHVANGCHQLPSATEKRITAQSLPKPFFGPRRAKSILLASVARE